MGNSASSLPYSIDKQVGAPQDHNGWSFHYGKSTDGTGQEVSVFVGKKPMLVKTPCSQSNPSKTLLQPALHHYNYSRKLRHPQILKVLATLDTDNPAAASTEGGAANPAAAAAASTSTKTTTGDLIIVTEPCISLNEWLTQHNPSNDQLAWGLECIIHGLHFLHTSANLLHGNIQPSSFYVTKSGDVKLWNFSLVTEGNLHQHFQQYEMVCTPASYRSPERQSQSWTVIQNAGIHAMDSYSLGILIGQDYYIKAGRPVPAPLTKALQRLQTANVKMRPRIQPLLKCPIFDTQYQKLQHQLGEIQIQPVEQKIGLWQHLGQPSVLQTLPNDVALYKILPLIIQSTYTICQNESMLAQDMYRREVLAMLIPLFYIEEQYQDSTKIGKELAPLVSKLFLVPDRGVRSVLLNQVSFMTQHLDRNALNSSVFEPMCSGFNDSSPALRELTLKATLGLVPSLSSPNMEKLSRYLVRLQSDTETSIRTNAVIFIAKIAPHLSEMSKQKMLLPAYGRAMKDPFPPCRLSALQSTFQSKSLFSIQDIASKVLPSVIPLTLDPIPDVRKEAFRVVRNMLQDLEKESKRLEQLPQPQQQATPGGGNVPTAPSSTPQRPVSNGTPVAPAPASGGSARYLSGLSSWMTSSAQPNDVTATAAAASNTTPSKLPPTTAPAATMVGTSSAPQLPTQQFSRLTTNAPAPSSVNVADEGWGDDVEDDDDWGDDQDEDPFANIGTKTVSATPISQKTPPKPVNPAMGGFGGVNDDPFASFGMKASTPAVKPLSTGGKLALPKKTNLTSKKITAAKPATKLTMDKDEVADGWDDF